jgi:hypothetical protein
MAVTVDSSDGGLFGGAVKVAVVDGTSDASVTVDGGAFASRRRSLVRRQKTSSSREDVERPIERPVAVCDDRVSLSSRRTALGTVVLLRPTVARRQNRRQQKQQEERRHRGTGRSRRHRASALRADAGDTEEAVAGGVSFAWYSIFFKTKTHRRTHRRRAHSSSTFVFARRTESWANGIVCSDFLQPCGLSVLCLKRYPPGSKNTFETLI